MDIKKLKELALRATQGPWFQWSTSIYAGKPEEITQTVLRGHAAEICEMNCDAGDHDQAYIAAANPSAVLQLIAQRDELLAALKDARDVLDGVRGDINPMRGYADELETDVETAFGDSATVIAKCEAQS